MRKYLFMMAFVLPFVFVCCSSDDDEGSNRLVGTRWVSENAGSSLYGMMEGKRYWHVREFTSNTTYDSYYEEILTGIKGKSGYLTDQKYEFHDTYVIFYDNNNSPVKWYFVSSTELCNKQNRTDANSVIYTKK